jgi:hypothetical protein
MEIENETNVNKGLQEDFDIAEAKKKELQQVYSELSLKLK